RLACALLPQVMRRRQHEDGWEWRAEPLDLGDEGERRRRLETLETPLRELRDSLCSTFLPCKH
ncbi:unnamed protein product, partial [Durusdinium trenchii]